MVSHDFPKKRLAGLLSLQVRDSKVKFLKDEELGTVVHVHKPQKAQQQQQHQVGDQGY